MTKSIHRWSVSFVILGMLYLAMEVTARAVRGELVGCRGLEYAAFAGWSSLWMFFIGGFCAVAIGALNEYYPRTRLWLQCLLGTAFVFIVELGSGCMFNLALGWKLWDYSAWPMNICGQVTLVYLPVWFLVCPTAIWLDDILRLGLEGMGSRDSILSVYKDLFTGA